VTPLRPQSWNLSDQPVLQPLEIVETSMDFGSRLQDLCNKRALLRHVIMAGAPERAREICLLPWTKTLSVELSLTRVQFIDCALQSFKLLSSLAQLAFRCQALVVGKVFGSFRDEYIEICCGLGHANGCWRGS